MCLSCCFSIERGREREKEENEHLKIIKNSENQNLPNPIEKRHKPNEACYKSVDSKGKECKPRLSHQTN